MNPERPPSSDPLEGIEERNAQATRDREERVRQFSEEVQRAVDAHRAAAQEGSPQQPNGTESAPEPIRTQETPEFFTQERIAEVNERLRQYVESQESVEHEPNQETQQEGTGEQEAAAPEQLRTLAQVREANRGQSVFGLMRAHPGEAALVGGGTAVAGVAGAGILWAASAYLNAVPGIVAASPYIGAVAGAGSFLWTITKFGLFDLLVYRALFANKMEGTKMLMNDWFGFLNPGKPIFKDVGSHSAPKKKAPASHGGGDHGHGGNDHGGGDHGGGHH